MSTLPQELLDAFGDADLNRAIRELREGREEFEEEAEDYEHEPDAKSASRSIDRSNAAYINKRYG